MYPTLFPIGIGGFEIPDRTCSISFQKQAEYYLDLADRSFRYHHSFLFVVLNIIQRRTAHLHTHFTIRRSQFERVATKLVAVKSSTLRSVADHLENEGKYNNLTAEQKNAMDLLKHVNTIAARIPGSQAAKIFMRNEIRSYCGFFGLPHIYITLNPSAAHSPIFQLIFGDEMVDLSKRFPILVSARERALRLAKDPVAGADFFNFCITSIFQYLFGWDYGKRESTPSGGILGKLNAFYGSSEFTERGILHGHFLLWLLGGLNPADVHRKMRDDEDFKTRFFAFFEDIIHHHLPEIDGIEIDKSFEPRVERPPQPPPVDATMEILNEWESVFCTQLKMCGEVLQRHGCRKVCNKYGNDNRCRFMFPHEIVEASWFDPETNSIFMVVRDATVNYLNPYLLVFCRHNHDIKCILSGKAAKAAMFYITDYITKSDLKTHEMLSLLSRAVAKMGDSIDDKNPVTRSKTLLHKCLSQFTRQQQIHAQQAARYIRGFDDSIPSHKTIPMLSALLISYIKKGMRMESSSTSSSNEPPAGEADSDDDDDIQDDEHSQNEREDVALKILLNRDGTLRETNQVIDYLYRGEELHSMVFYDFCRCVRLEKISACKIRSTTDARLGVLTRHQLKQGHPCFKTHHLVEHTNELRGEGSDVLVPRIVGMSIPRTSDAGYRIFALAHFVPFDIDNLLPGPGRTIDDVYENANFCDRHLEILGNWEAIHECQDERDAERMHKRAEQSRESRAMTRALHGTIEGDADMTIVSTKRNVTRETQAEILVELMRQCGWIQTNNKLQSCVPHVADETVYPEPTSSQLKVWASIIKQQEAIMMSRRRNATSVGEQVDVRKTDIHNGSVLHGLSSDIGAPAANTEAPRQYATASSIGESVQSVAETFGLNGEQRMVYDIVAQKFVSQNVLNTEGEARPLRMLMTGPGGTGKTHAVKALQELMRLHGLQHLIRFLGPTGTSAKQIGGMTIHKGLGLSVALKLKGHGNRKPGESNEDYSVKIGVKNRTLIRDEWRHVLWLFIDEVSLIGAQLLAQVDHALRYAKERPDEWFGGINIILSGDFYQYPPVGSTPLYAPIQPRAPQSTSDVEKRLGRLAWKSIDVVLSLNEQHRMKEDPEYAAAVGRLRMRDCTLGDVELFNERVVRSLKHTNGFNMNGERQTATMLVTTNFTRELLNNSKAKSTCTGELIYCAAHDLVDGAEPSADERKRLLALNLADFSSEGALPGLVPLFVGMPVILRNRNICTELGITNGSQGIVRKIFTKPCANNHSVAQCVIVEFPDSTVEIPNLPSHCFPLTPTKWRFTTVLNDATNNASRTVHIVRSQLNLQPAFAITGHAAQGKTLQNVLVDLREGGFAAYVSASRARTRHGLFITSPITLNDLNKPVHSNLRQECRRLERLEHNTKIRYGFQTGKVMPLLDPESETDLSSATMPKPIAALPLQVQLPPAGCAWSNNSCAYDTFFMLLFSMYRNSPDVWQQLFKGSGPWFVFLADMFEFLMLPDNLTNPLYFSQHRDTLRSMLSSHDSSSFPVAGREYTSILRIFEAFLGESCFSQMLSQELRCDCGHPEIRNSFNLAGSCSQSMWTNASASTDFQYELDHAPIQLFIDLHIAAKLRRAVTSECSQCHYIRAASIYLCSPSPWLFIEVPANVYPQQDVSENLEIRGETGPLRYKLFAIVYYNGSHFIGAWTNGNGSHWGYDGLANGGRPEQLQWTDLWSRRKYKECEIHIALYSLTITSSPGEFHTDQ